MRRIFPLLAVVLMGACASDAERRETLRAYEEKGPSVANCDKTAALNVLAMMAAPEMTRVSTTENGWVVVHFGRDYASWTPAQREAMVTSFANADACIQGKARHIEFQSPSGAVIARADEVRGICMNP